VRQAVGTKAVPLGQIVEVNYHVGFNYMEVLQRAYYNFSSDLT
jgi:hypothetical protein